MRTNIAINGFGRIGRGVLRALSEKGAFKDFVRLVAIADKNPDARYFAYQLRHDSIHKNYSGRVETGRSGLPGPYEDLLCLDGETAVCVSAASSPEALPWKKLGVDLVIEASGVYTSYEDVSGHLRAGARKVILSSMSRDPRMKTLMMGINDHEYDPMNHHLLSNASCTANCMAPLIRVLLDSRIGIEKGFASILLPYTSSCKIVDGYSGRSFRSGRSAAVNIIPSRLEASKAVSEVIPEIRGKLVDTVYRVPVPDVSLIDLSFISKSSASIEEVDALLKEAALGRFQSILGVTEDDLVSSDLIDDPHSCIYDSRATLENAFPAEENSFFKIIAWYDNEWGYANRLAELAIKVASEIH